MSVATAHSSCTLAYVVQTVRGVVALHRFDIATIGRETGSACVALVGDVALDVRAFVALADFSVHRVADAAALATLTANTTVDAVVAGSCAGLAELASRIRARLIVLAAELPEALVDAVGRGLDGVWVPDVAALVAELRRLRNPRSAHSVRHKLAGVRVAAPALAQAARLHDLSNDGMAFEVADSDVERLLPGNALDGLTLAREGRVCAAGMRALVRHVEALPGAGRYLVGCALKPPAAAPTANAPGRRVDNVALCAALVKAGLKSGIVIAPLDGDGHDGTHELQLTGGRVDVARGTISAACDGALAEHELIRGQFELVGRRYRFTSVVLSAAPLLLKLPSVVEETHQRASARHRLQPSEALTVEVRSPLDDGTALKRVVDLSSSGFSFAVDGARDLYPIGLKLDVALRLPDGALVGPAEVRTLVREGAHLRCGVELIEADSQSRLRLANFVMRLRFPGVDDGGGLTGDELFAFFRATGFLYPEKERVLAPVIDETREAFAALYARPSPVFKAVVSRDHAGALVGHVSGVRAYRHTWMSQHLAAQPSKHVAHLLNLGAAEYFGQNPDLEFFKIYFHADNKWPARVFGGFARMLRDSSQSELRSYRHVTLPTDSAPLPGPTGIDVLEAAPDDLAIVERHFVTREKGLLLRADDLTRHALQLSEVNKSFAAIGLYRRRRVLVAMRRNKCLGFALAELSSPGLNLSEALSAFQIFVTDEGAAAQDDVRRALVNAVVPIYRHAGRAVARGLLTPDEAGAYERIGLALNDEVSMCWTCHRDLYPRFCDHVERLFAALERRGRRA